MKKISMVFGCLLSIMLQQSFLLCQVSFAEEPASYIVEIANNTDMPLIISSPFFATEYIAVAPVKDQAASIAKYCLKTSQTECMDGCTGKQDTIKSMKSYVSEDKNASFKDQTECMQEYGCAKDQAVYRNSLIIPAHTKSRVENLRIPKVSIKEKLPENFKLRPNNYNPLTMQAIGFHIPAQNYPLNYTMVHKPLPLVAFRQKGDIEKNRYNLEHVFGQGVRAIARKDEKNQDDAHQFYAVEVNQLKPVDYSQSKPEHVHELYDLSTMYLDGGSQVTPLSVEPNTFDIIIKRMYKKS